MSEAEIALRVAASLTGEFYVGRCVRIGGNWDGPNLGELAVLIGQLAKEPKVWKLDRIISPSTVDYYWHQDRLEPV